MTEDKLNSFTYTLQPFIEFYNLLEENKFKIQSIHSNPITIEESLLLKSRHHSTHKLKPVSYDKRCIQKLRYMMPLCHFVGKNMWILKPTFLNRGRGIHVFRSLTQLKSLISEYIYGSEISKGESIKITSFVIQKYIESPLLINQRKFDIRCWVLVTPELNAYFFKEGYLRTSSSKFDIHGEIDDIYMHLTNNAIQKNSTNYGEYEDGNQLSFTDFNKYLEQIPNSVSFYKVILPEMKNLAKKSLYSVRKKLNCEARNSCFEIYGYDYIIDADCNPWLIEVNTNPCLEESSNLLKMLLPRMLDDAFKLTLDMLFPPLKNTPGAIHPVSGYSNSESMWYGCKQGKALRYE